MEICHLNLTNIVDFNSKTNPKSNINFNFFKIILSLVLDCL